jgi:two-component system cell cycle sensor histidine kinase/response regulator CckA
MVDRPAEIEGDAGALQSLVMNLVTNAKDSLPDGRGFIAISVGVTSRDRKALDRLDIDGGASPGLFAYVRVRDTGIGIDETARARMFDPFFTTKSTGHGLGLSSVVGTVRAHHGGIDVESVPGAGTTITVFLPLAAEASEAPRTDAGLPAAGDVASAIPSRGGEGRLVLLADDEGSLRRSIARLLEDAGYRIIPARDGLEAIEAVRTRGDEIAIALLDAVMPHAGGLAAALAIRGAGHAIPIVIMTGYPTDEIAGEGVVVLRKPFEPATLLRMLERALESPGLSERLTNIAPTT